MMLKADDRVEIKWSTTYDKSGVVISQTEPVCRRLPRNFWEWVGAWLWRWLGYPDFRPIPVNTTRKAITPYG